MHIKTLRLHHYRGAHHLDLNLHPRLNVFFGVNGAGKTTVLDAGAVLLSWAVSRINHAGSSGRKILEDHINNAGSAASIEINTGGEDSVSWRLTKVRKGHTTKMGPSHLSGLNEFAGQLRQRITDTEQQVDLPLFVYYPVNRAVLDIPLRIRSKHKFSVLSAYDDALTSGAGFRLFFEWFREREDLENENRRDLHLAQKPEGFQFPDPQLEAVRKALAQLMPQFQNLTVRRSPLRMEVEKDGVKLTVDQLSDGEKCLMAMVGDLARRMSIANPTLENPLEGKGVVLIDEIDLHLHPKWQKMIVPGLLQTFPNCQFCVTTHSPGVITHVAPESLYMLRLTRDGMQSEQPGESYGKNVDRILEDLMGLETTRPDDVAHNLQKLYLDIQQKKFDQAREMIGEIQSQIGQDPELAKAEVLIRRMEFLGK